MNPTVSVIVPIYNVERYLERCLSSIINQTSKNIEIILVNDGSPDNSGAICDKYAKVDHRIKVKHQENKGLSGARNSGMRMAKGDYLLFVDSDDWLHEKTVETLLSYTLKHNSELTCYLFHESDKPLIDIDFQNLEPNFIDKKELLYNYLKHGFYVQRNLYSSTLLKNLAFDESKKFVEDIFFAADVLEITNKALFINCPLYYYNVNNESSLTSANYNKNTFLTLEANINLQEKINAIFPNDSTIKKILRKRIVGNCLYHFQNLYKKENQNLDTDGFFKKKTKKAYNRNFRLNEKLTFFKLIVRMLPYSQLKFFYKMYFTTKSLLY